MTKGFSPRDQAREAGAKEGAPVSPELAAQRAVAMARVVEQSETIPIFLARGRVVASAARAVIAVPPFDNSAMDGYAVRMSALSGNEPWVLPVAGRITAGDAIDHLDAAGATALRILTGAPVPTGFDAVVMQENCRRDGERVTILRRPRHGENIRRAGEDVKLGSDLLHAGDLLTPQRLALLAGAGVAEITVFRKVRVALISTGSELQETGQVLGPGQIYNSNRVLIRSTLEECDWAQVRDFGIVPDDRSQLEQALREAAESCDVVITTGGVSAGDEDHVAGVLSEIGGKLEVFRVAMRPGKPVKIGIVDDTLFIGLPGNPNAALVTFRRFALPAIRAVAGLAQTGPEWQAAIAGFGYSKRAGRTEFVPVRIMGRNESGLPVLDMLGRGSSASLSAMAAADGIACLPAEDETIEPGATLRFEPF